MNVVVGCWLRFHDAGDGTVHRSCPSCPVDVVLARGRYVVT